ncbi:2-oxoacid:acceptor oxidoreductase family protein [Solirubrobacter soli]|uniref:2-oxoacid:acceptor oxidoreductase family protein n=1 Tax=Solirubrobacter soli TaxID=363832 RepID=UPI000411573C|nr:2-oxoacid:acceptor oxidoreductase family protein [Solirubrobacter soli]
MLKVRFHGRGGQGVVTSAELLAVAAFRDGLHAQAFPLFGSERTGAPVMAFCRIDHHEIRTREPIADPDVLVVQDPTLLHSIDLSAPLLLVNTSGDVEAPGRVITVAATELARRHLGRPMPGTALLGALVATTGVATFGALEAAIRERFSGALADGNVAAARAAYDAVHAHA